MMCDVAIIRRTASAVFFASVLSATNTAGAQITRLTSHIGEDCVVTGTAVSQGSEFRTAFESTCDFVGTNVDGNREIFWVDSAGVVTQATATTGCTNTAPSLNDTGDTVVFESDCDTGTNPDRNIEIFRVDSQGMVALTMTSFCTSLSPSINGAGTLVAFDSDCDFTVGNIDGSVEIFQLVPGGAVTQLTDDGGESTGCASINAVSDFSGDSVAFESDCDLIGTNSDQVSEIFQYRSGVGVVQLTASIGEPCINATPATSQDGMSIAFSSDCDLVGDNLDNGSEIFVNHRDLGDSQVTLTPGDEDCESLSPSIAADENGERIVFASYCNLNSGNADGSYEIFRSDNGALAALTSAADCANVSPVITGSGDRTVFLSNCDLGEGPSDGLDLYMIDLCSCGGPISRSTPTATDSLLALNAAVGNSSCALCDCDVNGDSLLTATDALLILNKAVGVDVDLACDQP